MAIVSFQLDPEVLAGGVTQAEFDAHTHDYEKMTGCDEAKCTPHVYTPVATEAPN